MTRKLEQLFDLPPTQEEIDTAVPSLPDNRATLATIDEAIDKIEQSYLKKVPQSLSVVLENEPSQLPKTGVRGNEVERMKQTSPFRSRAPRFKRLNTEEEESPGPATY